MFVKYANIPLHTFFIKSKTNYPRFHPLNFIFVRLFHLVNSKIQHQLKALKNIIKPNGILLANTPVIIPMNIENNIVFNFSFFFIFLLLINNVVNVALGKFTDKILSIASLIQ